MLNYSSVVNALLTQSIYFVYQPIVNLSTRKIVGYEALTRWNGYNALDVIEAIETHELVLLWISNQLLEINRAIKKIPEPLYISWNIGHDALIEPFLTHSLNSFSYPDRLHIEILESVRLDKTSHRFLSELDPRIKIKADDIGFQYPWLNRLVGAYSIHFDGLKLCRDLTVDILSDPKCAAACRHILAYANEFGLDTTAEWVYCEEQAQLLYHYGCINGQGELFGLGNSLPMQVMPPP